MICEIFTGPKVDTWRRKRRKVKSAGEKRVSYLVSCSSVYKTIYGTFVGYTFHLFDVCIKFLNIFRF